MVSTIQAKLWGKEAAKMTALCGALFLVWYAVMLVTGWYDPGFHAIAVLSSVVMVKTGHSWGIVEKIAA